jgi:hypothetical protein
LITVFLIALALAQPPTGAIGGVVVDRDGGTPLQRVSVRLQTDGRTITTDESGRFVIADVPAGVHELYVSAVDFMLVKRAVTVVAGGTAELTIALSEGTGTYSETVDVRGSTSAVSRRDPEVAAEQRLGNADLLQLRGLLTNDPMRAIQVLPGVTTGDDFRSEFAVRGLAVPQMNFTFEGVASPFLVHTVQQVRETGSLGMVNGDILEDVSLLSGAYPQRFGNRLGAELDFRMREGSRDRLQSHASISTTDAAFIVEGPIGQGGHGSWLLSARKSYLDLVIRRLYATQGIAFGFEDTQAKVVYDVAPHHQLQFAITAGQSALDRDPDTIPASSIQLGENSSVVAVATWRYVASPRFALFQRVALTTNQFRNATENAIELDRGDSRDVLYRADWTFVPASRVSIEGGGELRHSGMSLLDTHLSSGVRELRDTFDSSAATESAYVQTRVSLPGGASIVPGIRVDHWGFSGRTQPSPWITAAWPLGKSLTLRGGAGIYRQEPNFVETTGLHGTAALDDQQASDVDVGIEGHIGSAWRWQTTFYDREDRGRLRLPSTEGRVVRNAFVGGTLSSHYVNALDGSARGVEFVLQRRSPNGLSGWFSYAYGENRYDDTTTGESFWGDFDQRHTVNVYGTYRLTDRMSASGRFRAGSNFPATGYYREQDGVIYANDVRNTLRIPYYARVDVRLNRTFTWDRKRLTLYIEGLNVLNRDNVRLSGSPDVDRRTLVTTKLFEEMMPIVPSIGLLLEF